MSWSYCILRYARNNNNNNNKEKNLLGGNFTLNKIQFIFDGIFLSFNIVKVIVFPYIYCQIVYILTKLKGFYKIQLGTYLTTTHYIWVYTYFCKLSCFIFHNNLP